jgi:hypothetical protein
MTNLSQLLIFFLKTEHNDENLQYLHGLSIAGPHCLWLPHWDMDGGFLTVAEPHCVVALLEKQPKKRH